MQGISIWIDQWEVEQKASVYTNPAFDDQNNAKHFFLQTNFEERQNKDVAA